MGKSSKRSRGLSKSAQNSSNGNGGAHQQNSGSTTNGRHRPADPPQQQFLSPQAQRAANIGSTLIHFGIIWLVVGLLVRAGKVYLQKLEQEEGGGGANITAASAASAQRVSVGDAAKETAPASKAGKSWGGYAIPPEMTGPMSSYPDPLGITDEMRKDFHPVVVFPEVWADVIEGAEGGGGRKKVRREKVANYQVVDYSQPPESPPIVGKSEWTERIRERKKSRVKIPFGVGRYDENRPSMYSSELFLNETNDIDGYAGGRTIHVGLDLNGPVGTKVHAFTDGVIHSAGYNPELGDYGHVVVVEHLLPPLPSEMESVDVSKEQRKVWALYGHLDAKSVRGKKPGKRIKKGQVLGRMGDMNENGGWKTAHVHFQLSINSPETHDMPGVVSFADRPRALVEYPDPRLVLGPVY